MRGRWIALLPLAMLACAGSESETGSRRDLQDARELWATHGLESYDAEQTMSCFCPPPREWIVHVRDGAIEGITLIDTEGLSESEITEYEARARGSAATVEDNFALIDDALWRAHRVDVRYDEVSGYPREISIDYDDMIADEEIHRTMDSLAAPDTP